MLVAPSSASGVVGSWVVGVEVNGSFAGSDGVVRLALVFQGIAEVTKGWCVILVEVNGSLVFGDGVVQLTLVFQVTYRGCYGRWRPRAARLPPRGNTRSALRGPLCSRSPLVKELPISSADPEVGGMTAPRPNAASPPPLRVGWVLFQRFARRRKRLVGGSDNRCASPPRRASAAPSWFATALRYS